MSAFKDEEVISKYKDIRDIAKTFGASDYQANISAINKVVSDSKVGTFFSNIQKGATLAKASVGESANSIVKSIASIKGGLAGARASLSTFGKIGVVLAGVAATVSVIKAIYDALDDAFILNGATAENKMNDAFDAYDSAKAEDCK